MVTKRLTEQGINTKPTFAEYEGKREVVFMSNRVGYSNIYRIPYDLKTR